ncbi:MAG: FIST N-terminal domain-containing protein [Pseudomonadota bacterium]
MKRPDKTVTKCGIRVAGTSKLNTHDAIMDLRSQIGATPYQHLIVLFSISHVPSVLCEAIQVAFPKIPYSGCTTAGEFGPHGMTDSGIVIIAFPVEGFSICAEVITEIDQFGVERATNTARTMRAKLLERAAPCRATRHGVDREKQIFALLLVDGLSNFEEMLVAAINWAMGDLQLIGGSSADQLFYDRATLVQNGRTFSNAALLLLVETSHPFKLFRTQDFRPSDTKFVVTAADAERRIVRELNAEPAAIEYARAINRTSQDLDAYAFASHTLGVRIGDEHYCRSIRAANPDNSLSFFCAIDEGLVLTLAKTPDLVASTEEALRQLDVALDGLDLVIGFDCILRRLNAEQGQARHHLESTYRKHRVVGFHTYGEQFNAMHLNQTLTGIAFGGRQVAQ